MKPSNVWAARKELAARPLQAILPSPWIRALPFALVITDRWADAIAVPFLAIVTVLRLLWLNNPAESIIFDEKFYVNAARVMLGWPLPTGAPYQGMPAGIDPNLAHLPLAKAMIAGSMALFGDTPLGWRLPSVVMGVVAVAVIYLLVRHLTHRPWLALFAAFIFSFDNLVFVHSRIATLDIFMVSFLLLGVYAYARERPGMAGAAIALSGLAKFNGIFGLAAIIGFEVLRLILRPDVRARWRRILADNLLFVGSFVFVFLAVLWGLDQSFTTFKSPLDHVGHVFDVGLSLRQDNPQGIASMPWQWLMNESVIPYYRVNVDSVADGAVVSSRSLVSFSGQMNLYVITMLPLALAYLIHAALKKRDDLSLLMLALFAATFVQPFASAVLFHRISYIFYFLPVLPALCVGIAYFLLDSRLPRVLPVIYAVSVLLGFIAIFP
ncbi:MAG TPA: glycosyltransferase family 39 protein, partial [Tepidisphaeraceae bacterium]|nr:glycosyltransferase family 39 protein [Tepidisphaeraceae bacterium]